MKSSFFMLASLALTGLSPAFAAEEHTTLPPPPGPVLGVKLPDYPTPRAGDLAPEFAFPGPGGKSWNLRDMRGKKAVMLVLTGPAPILVSERATPDEALNSILEAAKDLDKQGVQTVLISKAIGVDLSQLGADQKMIGLRDDKGEMAKLFRVSSTSLTLVAIDRAGFLRRVETIRDVADVGPDMLKIGDPTPQWEVGKAAPDFSLTDMNGHVRRLADLRGQKNVILTFFPKCFTGGCANQLASLRGAREELRKTDTQVWGVSTDPAHSVDAATGVDSGQVSFATSLAIDYPLLPDTGRNVCLLYGAASDISQSAARMTFLIDKDGVLRYIDKAVAPRSHGPDCLAKMREVGMTKWKNQKQQRPR